jgi:hypothetical protein
MQDQLRCRECDKSPAEASDDVSPQATAYTCPICLLVGFRRGAATPVQAPLEEASRTRMNSGDSSRVSITRAREGARRGGRPRKHTSDRIARREASRAYRARRKDNDAAQDR